MLHPGAPLGLSTQAPQPCAGTSRTAQTAAPGGQLAMPCHTRQQPHTAHRARRHAHGSYDSIVRSQRSASSTGIFLRAA